MTEARSEKASAEPTPPEQKVSVEKQIPKEETAPAKENIKDPSPSQAKAKTHSPPPKPTASEPQLPPKDRERRAAVNALHNQPVVNAVDGDIIYRDYIDISIAVGTSKGPVVPVIRNADKMNFAEIEKEEINMLDKKVNDGSISINEMAGGTFTISNGGIYGNLLSTLIINPLQSAIRHMHSIVTRPIVVEGNIVPRPTMCIELTNDPRLIDGREAVFFLHRIKDVVEDPGGWEASP